MLNYSQSVSAVVANLVQNQKNTRLFYVEDADENVIKGEVTLSGVYIEQNGLHYFADAEPILQYWLPLIVEHFNYLDKNIEAVKNQANKVVDSINATLEILDQKTPLLQYCDEMRYICDNLNKAKTLLLKISLTADDCL